MFPGNAHWELSLAAPGNSWAAAGHAAHAMPGQLPGSFRAAPVGAPGSFVCASRASKKPRKISEVTIHWPRRCFRAARVTIHCACQSFRASEQPPKSSEVSIHWPCQWIMSSQLHPGIPQVTIHWPCRMIMSPCEAAEIAKKAPESQKVTIH